LARALRYSVIVGLVALGTGLAAAGGWRYARASAPVSGPIILISVDSLRADRLPAYGFAAGRTPAIDSLAADGVVFERAYAHVPETLPSHASLFSGRLPFETGVRDDAGFTVKTSERLLAEILRDRGYATGGVVSTFALRKESGIGQGFTFFDDAMSPAPPDLAVDGLARDSDESEQVAERWLGSVGTGRAFLFLHLGRPRPAARAETGAIAVRSPYDDQIESVDSSVGRLVRYLKAHQLYDPSTIILLSDHGEGLGDHGEQAHGLFVYEEALRVPLIVKQAVAEGAGRRVSDIVQQIDLLPTILDLAKAPVPGNVSGRSLKPLLEGTGHLTGRSIYGESLFGRYHFGWSALATLTDGRYRYIKAPREELYELQQDPAEKVNLADDPKHAETLRRFRARLHELDTSAAVPPMEDLSAENRRRFEALGDVGEHGGDMAAADAPADPKDMYQILETYRSAVGLAAARQWTTALRQLATLLHRQPELADGWRQVARIAMDADRPEQALDAYRRLAALQPDDALARLGAAAALMRLRRQDEARRQAELALSVAPEDDGAIRRSAHELLARLAIARRDAETAREEARLAGEADPASPVPSYVEGQLLYDHGRYEDALPLFERAIADSTKAGRPPVADLRYYTGDTLSRLGRGAEAESQFLAELKDFPQNTRAWAAVIARYRDTGRIDEAKAAIADLTRVSPTTGAFSLAARLWGAVGDRRQADVARTEGQRLAASLPPPLPPPPPRTR
jgi:choline-sulfatase